MHDLAVCYSGDKLTLSGERNEKDEWRQKEEVGVEMRENDDTLACMCAHL